MDNAPKKIWYCVDDSDYRNAHQLIVKDRPPHYWECIAEECADDYHSNHDGYESSWPLRFFIRESEEGPIIAMFDVDREVVPQFTVRKAT